MDREIFARQAAQVAGESAAGREAALTAAVREMTIESPGLTALAGGARKEAPSTIGSARSLNSSSLPQPELPSGRDDGSEGA